MSESLNQPPNLGVKMDLITSEIDAAIVECEASGPTDLLGIQDEVWQIVFEGAERGDYTMDEATERYRKWHNTYHAGSVAVASQTTGMHPQIAADSKRRMRRC